MPGRLYIHSRFFVLLFLLIGLIKYTKGTSGLKDLFKPMLIWKVPVRRYLFICIFASSIACLTLCLEAFYLGTALIPICLNFSVFDNPGFILNTIMFAFVGELV